MPLYVIVLDGTNDRRTLTYFAEMMQAELRSRFIIVLFSTTRRASYRDTHFITITINPSIGILIDENIN